MISYKFDQKEERNILVLGKGEAIFHALCVTISLNLFWTFKDILREARDGVDVSGNIQSGDINVQDYQFVLPLVLPHPNMMPDSSSRIDEMEISKSNTIFVSWYQRPVIHWLVNKQLF